jgi:lipopolysaccharide heptosyltransferase I
MLGGSRIPICEYVPRRIAIIKPSALGDIVHSLPVLTAVRQRYPHAHIAWVVNRSYQGLLQGHPDLDAVLPFDRSASRGGPVKAALTYGGFLRAFRRQQFDLVLDLQGLFRTGLMAAASGAARRVGLSTAREGAVWFYSDAVPVADFDAIHAVDRYWLIARALGTRDGPKQFRVPIAEEAKRWAADLLGECPRPWLFFGVGSRWMTKRWPPEHFAVLARKAQEYAGGTVLFVGSGEESSLAQATARRLTRPVRDLTGQTTLPQLAALLARATVMVANDTGPLHLAAALGRPVVAPYTCTRVLLNGPYGAEQGAVESAIWCQGSYLKKCNRLECMAELQPERLWPILQGILESWQRSSLSA